VKIKLDENMPALLAARLRERGHDADTAVDEGFAGWDDGALFAASQRELRFFVTQDLDFFDIRIFAPGTHCGVMLLRLGNAGRLALTERALKVFDTIPDARLTGAFVVVTPRRVRVLSPPP
jgi:predicted nuclease of predicted toxin-antitoxin system